MKRFFIIVLYVACLFSAHEIKAQSCKDVYSAQAFYTIRMPGNIPVLPNGEQARPRIDTSNFIYIETMPNVKISWETAWKNGKSYSIHTEEAANPVEINNRGKGAVKIIATKPGNKIWLLSLEPSEEGIKMPSQKAIKPGEILLMGKKGKKLIYKTISSQMEIHGPDAV